MTGDMFEDGDPFADPAWKAAEKPKRKRKGNGRHIGCPIDWLKWVHPLLLSKQQLLLALLLYRRCSLCNSSTITVPGSDLAELGLSRFSKSRWLYRFEQLGILHVEEQPQIGRALQVTLLHWPDPPPPSWTPPDRS